MHVLMVNGSPHEAGCSFTALTEIAKELEQQGVTSEIVQSGTKAIHGCIGCGQCRARNNRCVFEDDVVNQIIEKAEKADGFVFASPVYFAGVNGTMVSLLDRLFMAGKSAFRMKPGACVVSARRAGTTATYDQLNKYLGLSEMIQVPSVYWNMVHGSAPTDVHKDEEGVRIMRTLGRNMAWLLKVLENAKQNGIALPESLPPVRTNYIR